MSMTVQGVNVEYEAVKIDAAPKEISAWAESIRKTQCCKMKKHEGHVYVFISLGKQNICGYEIIPQEMTAVQDKLHLYFRVVSPRSATDMMVEAENYPYILLQFANEYASCKINWK